MSVKYRRFLSVCGVCVSRVMSDVFLISYVLRQRNDTDPPASRLWPVARDSETTAIVDGSPEARVRIVVRHVPPAPHPMRPSTPPARMASGAGIFQGGKLTGPSIFSSATDKAFQNCGTPKCVA